MKNSILLLALLAVALFACQSQKTPKTSDSEAIRINQIGYYPTSAKQFAVADLAATTFEVVDTTYKVVFSGELKDNGTWETSGEKILMGDFSELKTPGIYRVLLNEGTASYKFEIKPDVYKDALNASIKSFYLQRSSMPIEEKYAGIFKRTAGHPDNQCPYHPSSGKSKGMLNSPGGWYDAGDYGKYIVNASISVGQMLLLVEQIGRAHV